MLFSIYVQKLSMQSHWIMYELLEVKGFQLSKVYSRHIFRNSLLTNCSFLRIYDYRIIRWFYLHRNNFWLSRYGAIIYSSISSRDYSVITALVMLYGFLALLGSLLSDIIMSIVDPRIRIE